MLGHLDGPTTNWNTINRLSSESLNPCSDTLLADKRGLEDMSDTGIAVVESTWWKKKNTSVRGLLEVIADVKVKNPHGYHYEMANNIDGLKRAIETLASAKDVRYLYIAMHGNDGGIVPHDGETLTATVLRNTLARAKQHRKSLRGLYLGCCEFGTVEVASKLFEKDISPIWIAGYSTEADWLQSSALDMLFLSTLISPLKNDVRETERQRIQRVVGMIQYAAPGLVENLGFGVYVRDSENGAYNLFEDFNGYDDLADAA